MAPLVIHRKKSYYVSAPSIKIEVEINVAASSFSCGQPDFSFGLVVHQTDTPNAKDWLVPGFSVRIRPVHLEVGELVALGVTPLFRLSDDFSGGLMAYRRAPHSRGPEHVALQRQIFHAMKDRPTLPRQSGNNQMRRAWFPHGENFERHLAPLRRLGERSLDGRTSHP